jgi:hypothetical protein
LLHNIITKLRQEFAMTDLNPLEQFLGISVARNSKVLFLSQEQYATELLDHANMTHCNPCLTPVATNAKPSGKPMANPTEYHSIASALQYLTIT